MKWISQCPTCAGELTAEIVEKLLRGGNNIASIKVEAMVCHKCGEIVYDAATIRKLQKIREKLAQNQVADFALLGQAYAVS